MPRIKNWKRANKHGNNTEVEWVHRPTGMRVTLEELPDGEDDSAWSPEVGGVRSGADWAVVIAGSDPHTKSYLGKNEGYDAATSFLRENPNLEPDLESWAPMEAADEHGLEEVIAGWVFEDGESLVVYYDEGYVVSQSDGNSETYETRFEAVSRTSEILGLDD